ncbi:MAG: hypothetical protein ABR964_03090 [Tepidisphaeraceae bacterium]|jgi:hypothetical protein
MSRHNHHDSVEAPPDRPVRAWPRWKRALAYAIYALAAAGAVELIDCRAQQTSGIGGATSIQR